MATQKQLAALRKARAAKKAKTSKRTTARRSTLKRTTRRKSTVRRKSLCGVTPAKLQKYIDKLQAANAELGMYVNSGSDSTITSAGLDCYNKVWTAITELRKKTEEM